MSGSFVTERIPGGAHQIAKQLIALQGEHGELLAIEFDAGLAETVDKSAVIQALLADQCIDPCDPKRTEIAFFLLAVAVRVSEDFFKCATGLPVQLAATDKAGS